MTMTRDITVRIQYAGTAELNEDFLAPTSVTVERGTRSADLSIHPINDMVAEETESIVVSLELDEQYLPYYELNPYSTQTISLINMPTLTIVFNQSSFQEDGDGASFTITRIGDDLSTELDVSLSYSGSTDSFDYDVNGTGTLYPGDSQSEVYLLGVQDSLIEGDEDITVTLNGTTAYQVGTPGSASILLKDTEPHVCEDSSIPWSHTVTACARFWGCSPASFFAKQGNTICYSWGYRYVGSGVLETYSCEEQHFNCELTGTEVLTDREDRDDGGFTIVWNDGGDWMHFSPFE